jgi:hypothetical protein
MGCGSTKSLRNKTYLSSLQEKIAASYQRTASNLTISNTSISNTKPLRCMKFKIVSKDLKFSRRTLLENWPGLQTKSFSYSKDYEFIKESYNSFIFIKRYLFTLCHEACVPDFNIKDSILILIISILANEKTEMSLIKSFPYFFIKGDLNQDTIEILKVWRDYVQFLEKIFETHEKLEKSAKNLQEFLLFIMKNKEKTIQVQDFFKQMKNIQEAISTCDMMVQEARKTKEEIKEFMKNVEIKEFSSLRKLGNKASQLKAFRADQIIHQVLSDN